MSLKKHVFLVGMPGCGKTTLGRAISDLFKLDFIDMDGLFEKKFGSSIQEYWEQHSEPEFRILERKLLFELMSGSPAVIATGGGLPCWFDNMHWICKMDVLHLWLEPEDLLENLQKQPRAIFKGEIPDIEQIVNLFHLRNPYYKRAGLNIHSKDIPVVLNFFKLHFLI